VTIGSWDVPWTVFPELLALGGFMWAVTRMVQGRRWALWLFGVSLGIGLWSGISAVRGGSGWAAVYWLLVVWVISVALGIIGLPMIAVSRLRKAGLTSLASGVMVLGGFYGVVLLAKLMGLMGPAKWQ
jgi:hypothetical protein